MKTAVLSFIFIFVLFTLPSREQNISAFAGTGTPGYGGDNALATFASLDYPNGVAVDGAGNLYIADWGNNRIRKVDSYTGDITTYAGNGTAGYSGDGFAAASARLSSPNQV